MQRKKLRLAKAGFSILASVLLLVPVVLASGSGGANRGNIAVTLLYSFDGTELIYPAGPIVAQGFDGNLYSTTAYGGTYNDGVVFKITTEGIPSVLHELDSYNGSTGLTLGADGNFYGAEIYGGPPPGYGAAFRITPTGKMTVLAHFTGKNLDAYPDVPPMQAADGEFYGTAVGDSNGNGGTVYRMTRLGKKTTLFRFDRRDGAAPGGPLAQAEDGNFYGITNVGGASGRCQQYGCGTVFKLTLDGHETVLHNFNVQNLDGYYPAAPVVEGTDGDFYGTAPYGGKFGYGIVFKITRTGAYTILHNFDQIDGMTPQVGLVQATDGKLYGTTEGGGTAKIGTVFSITPTGKFTTMYSFDGVAGAYPSAALIQHTDGKLYGFAGQGGSYNYGTFYSVDLGLEPFVSLVSTSGRIGKSIGILGQGFTGSTSVSFNGRSSKFDVMSDTYLTATVPAGATTGFVTVATAGGALKSSKKFRVTK